MLFAVITICVFTVVSSLDVIPERAEVVYFNPKYTEYVKVTARKPNRRSPYVFNWDFKSLTTFGNNMTIYFNLNEKLSGRYQPTMLVMQFKLCDFFYEEKNLGLGPSLLKQLPANFSCPVVPDDYHFHDVVVYVNNLPFTLPFTWASVSVKTRADISGYIVTKSGREIVFTIHYYVTIIQKPPKDSRPVSEKDHRPHAKV